VYLAGYTVECMLKALILDGVAKGRRKQLLAEFRGRRGHDIEWLRGMYRRHVQGSLPRDIVGHLALVATWDTDLRYATAASDEEDADDFIKSVAAIATWAEGRM
jgi:hypothetical protein